MNDKIYDSIDSLPDVRPGYTRLMHQTGIDAFEANKASMKARGLKFKNGIDLTSIILGQQSTWKKILLEYLPRSRNKANMGRYGNILTFFDVKTSDIRELLDYCSEHSAGCGIGYTGDNTYIGAVFITPIEERKRKVTKPKMRKPVRKIKK